MTLEEIRAKIINREYLVSQHALMESAKDEIEDADVRNAVINGELLEEYHQDIRGKSVLVCGSTRDGRPLHVVLGIEFEIVIITVYIPTPPKWLTPTTRGGRSL